MENIFEEYASALPEDLTGLVDTYIPIRELVDLTIITLPHTLPSRSLWRRILKLRFPQVYARFKDKRIRLELPDVFTVMIMAGLYCPRFGPPLSKAKLIVDDYNMRLYLELSYHYYHDLDPQAMYEQLKAHLQHYGMVDSLIYLDSIGVQLDRSDVERVLPSHTLPIPQQRKLIRHLLRKYGQDVITDATYIRLVNDFPDLALKYVDLAPIRWYNWVHIKNVKVDLVPIYKRLIEAYANKLEPPTRSDLESCGKKPPKLIRELLAPYIVKARYIRSGRRATSSEESDDESIEE